MDSAYLYDKYGDPIYHDGWECRQGSQERVLLLAVKWPPPGGGPVGACKDLVPWPPPDPLLS
jgi:hypothetical protein